jgi:hypothetical protein
VCTRTAFRPTEKQKSSKNISRKIE